MKVLSFDPGVAPAAALYEGPGITPLIFPPMAVERPSIKKVDGKQKKVIRKDPDEAALLGIYNDNWPDVVSVEKVASMPGQGISSTARFMEATGMLCGMALGRGCRLIRVPPNEWQRAYKMPVGDDISRQVVVRMFPELVSYFRFKVSHNEADALLMAIYIWCKLNGKELPR